MLRHEHNAHYNVNRQADEQVCCNLFGYGEMSQYDADCSACVLGHKHTWQQHDSFIEKARVENKIQREKQFLSNLARIERPLSEALRLARLRLSKRQSHIRVLCAVNPDMTTIEAAHIEDSGKVPQWRKDRYRNQADYSDISTRLTFDRGFYFARLFYCDTPDWYCGSLGLTAKIAYQRAWSVRRKYTATVYYKRDKRGHLIN